MATFLLDPSVTFLNHGSFGATPREVLDVQSALRLRMEREPVDFLTRQLPGLLAEARAALAPALGAQPDDLAFVPNATTGVAAVLSSIELGPDDELLTTTHRYNAVRCALERRAAQAGARLVEAPLPWPVSSPEALAAAVIRRLSARTRLLVVDHITSPTALVLPVADIVAAARARGVPVLVDCAHAPGQVPVDLDGLGADWWVGNLHKWLCAPKGAALLWAAPHRQAQTRPAVPSHGTGLGFREEFDWPGTFDPTAWLAAPAALALHEAMGGPALQAAHHALVRRGREVVAEATGLPLPHPDDPRLYAAMAAIPLEVGAEHTRAVHDALWARHRVEVPVTAHDGDAVLRISGFAPTNRPADYARLAEVLPEVLAEVRRL